MFMKYTSIRYKIMYLHVLQDYQMHKDAANGINRGFLG